MLSRRLVLSSLVVMSTLGPALACGGGTEGKATQAGDGTLLTPYLAIGDVLAADKLDQLSELGAQVIAAAESRQGEPGVDAIVQGAGRIGAQDIQTARTAYKKMSDGMLAYLAAHPEQQAGHVIVHCTMTFGGKGGLWVQKEGKVMNPYEGAMMLHCGDKLAWGAELPKT
jgi:Cu(I)/Ag(I) efflux system membrane fusion protein